MPTDLVVAPEYDPFAKQKEFHRSNKRFKVAAAGNRGGKTLSGAAEFVGNIYRDLASGRGKTPVRIGSSRVPRLAYWVVTPTHELGEFPYRELVRFIPRELFDGNPNATTREFWLKGDIQVAFRSTERPERLVAASLNGVWIDEACRCKAEAWRSGLRARLADQQGWAIFTTSPLGGRDSWVYKELVSKEGIDEHIGSFHWTTEENPHIPREEIDHARRTLPDAWFKRDWEASWDSFGGSIYEEFNSDLHVISEAAFRLESGAGAMSWPELSRRRFRRVVAGVDWGLTSPGAIVVVGHLGENQFQVLEESYAAGRQINVGTVTWISEAKRLREKYGISLFACDPARNDAIQDFQTSGLPTVGAFNDIYLGIRRVVEALHPVDGRPGLRILDQAQNLISEARSYQWATTKDGGAFLEKPADGQSDHALDALRYAITELRPYTSQKKPQYYGAGRGPIG